MYYDSRYNCDTVFSVLATRVGGIIAQPTFLFRKTLQRESNPNLGLVLSDLNKMRLQSSEGHYFQRYIRVIEQTIYAFKRSGASFCGLLPRKELCYVDSGRTECRCKLL